MPKIIISYRRSDTQAIAGRIYDRLSGHYGDASVFMDIDKIPIGTDFRQYIRGELHNADLILAVIGPRWLGPRDGGGLRINDRADPVRVEIETAFEASIAIIPVLVDDASMPEEEKLPDSIKDFAFINAAVVDIGRDFRQHMDRLIRGIDSILSTRQTAAAAQPSTPAIPQPAPEEPPAAALRSETAAPAVVAPAGADTATPASTGRPWPRAAIWGSGLALGLLGLALYAAIELRSPGDPGPPPQTVEVQPPSARPPIDAAAAPTVNWRGQSAYPASQPTSMASFSKQVRALSNGRMSVEVLTAGQVVPAFQIFDAVVNGVLDVGFAPGTYWFGKSKAFPLMSAIPFGFAPREQLAFRRRADVKEIFDQLLTPLGVVALPCGSFGRSGEMWLRRGIATANNLRGLKVRVFGIDADIYKELGAAPVILPAGEIYSALERGVIDGARFLSPKADLDFGLQRVTKFYYHPGLTPPSAVVDLLINSKMWMSLPETGRTIITRACHDAADTMLEDQERADREALAEIARQGTIVNAVPGPIAQAMLAASQKVLGNFARGDRTVSAVMSIVEQMRSTTIAAQLR